MNLVVAVLKCGRSQSKSTMNEDARTDLRERWDEDGETMSRREIASRPLGVWREGWEVRTTRGAKKENGLAEGCLAVALRLGWGIKVADVDETFCRRKGGGEMRCKVGDASRPSGSRFRFRRARRSASIALRSSPRIPAVLRADGVCFGISSCLPSD